MGNCSQAHLCFYIKLVVLIPNGVCMCVHIYVLGGGE